MNIASPCIGVCQLHEAEICVGCWRTGEEIARWTQMRDAEKMFTRAALAGRKKNLCNQNHERVAP